MCLIAPGCQKADREDEGCVAIAEQVYLDRWLGPEVKAVEVQIAGPCPSCVYTAEESLISAGASDGSMGLVLLVEGGARARILRARLLAAAPSIASAMGRYIWIIDSVPRAFRQRDLPLLSYERDTCGMWQYVPWK